MASEPPHPQSLPVGSFWLLGATTLFYIPWLLSVLAAPSWLEPGGSGGGEDRFSESWAILYVLLFGMLLWLSLAGLLWLAWKHGTAPISWSTASGILFLLALIATMGAVRTHLAWPGGWSILVPAPLPQLLALYAIGVRVPLLSTGPMHLAPIAALGAIALVAFAAIPFASIDPTGYPARLAAHQRHWDAEFARRNARALDAARRWEADIQKLGPDSSLAAWLDYVNGSAGSEQLHQQALDGARGAKSRQTDVIALLDQGQIGRLTELWQFDLAVTPALCAAYNQALRRLATTDDPYESMVGEQIERQLPNIRFLVAANCDLASSLDAARARVVKVAAVNPGDAHWSQFAAALSTLRQNR